MHTVDEETSFTLELKYCEWCGALWFRSPASDSSYCDACARWIVSQLPPAQGEA